MGGEALIAGTVVFREALEAALIIGLIAGITRSYGSSAARLLAPPSLASLAAGILLGVAVYEIIGTLPEGELLEAASSGVAAALILATIYWVRHHGADSIRSAADRAMNTGVLGVWALVFFLVLREAVEAVLIIAPLASAGPGGVILGSLAGLVGASLVSVVLAVAGSRLGLVRMLRASTVLLVVFAVGLAGEASHAVLEELVGEGGGGFLGSMLYSFGGGGELWEVLAMLGVPGHMELARLVVEAAVLGLGVFLAGPRQ